MKPVHTLISQMVALNQKKMIFECSFPNKEFHQLLGMNIDTIFDMKLSVIKRREILALLLEYLSYHEISKSKADTICTCLTIHIRLKIKHKTNIFLLLLFLVNAIYSQE